MVYNVNRGVATGGCDTPNNSKYQIVGQTRIVAGQNRNSGRKKVKFFFF